MFSQNRIELITIDCSQVNGFTMFSLNQAHPKILTEQEFEEGQDYLSRQKRIVLNQIDSLRIEYTNIFGQQIDTTFANAKELSEIKICVNKYKDYEKKSLIRQSIEENKKWILSTSWGHQVFESDKLILKPKKEFLKFKYYKNGKRVKRGKIKITKIIIDRISLFERKLNLMQNADGGCNFGVSYYLDNGIEKLDFQDNSCNGFSNDQLLTELKIIE